MAHISIDYPDEVVHWFKSYPEDQRNRQVTGLCPHDCPHNAASTVAWGPDYRFYELLTCDVDDGCAGNCRGWMAATGASSWELHKQIEWKELAP